MRLLIFLLPWYFCSISYASWVRFDGTNYAQYVFFKPIGSMEVDLLQKILEARAELQTKILGRTANQQSVERLFFEISDSTPIDELLKILRQLEGRTSDGMVKVIHLQYTSADAVADFLQKLFGLYNESLAPSGVVAGIRQYKDNLRIVPNPTANTVVLDGPTLSVEKAIEVIRELDARTPQVLVEMLISEVSLNDDDSLGLEWNITGQGIGGQNVRNDTTVNFGNMGGPLEPVIRQGLQGLKASILNPGDFELFLTSLTQKNQISVVSRPKILTTNHKEAQFRATQRNPVLKTTNADGVVNSSVDYIDIGVTLRVTPRINRDNFVDLKIDQVIQEIVGFDRNALNSPIYSERSVATNVLVKDNHTLIIGGLISETDVEGISKIPIFSEIPLIRDAFQRKTRDKTKTELMIFLTPHILEDHNDAEEATRKEKDEIVASPLMEPYFFKSGEYRRQQAEKTQLVGKVVKIIPESGRIWIDVPNPDTIQSGDVLVVARHVENLIREGTHQWIGQDYESLAHVTVLGSVSDSVWLAEAQSKTLIGQLQKGDLVHRRRGSMIESDVRVRTDSLKASIVLTRSEAMTLEVSAELYLTMTNTDEKPLRSFTIVDGILTRHWKFFENQDERIPAVYRAPKARESQSGGYQVILPRPLEPQNQMVLRYAGPIPEFWLQKIRESRRFVITSNSIFETVYEIVVGAGVEARDLVTEPVARERLQSATLYRWYKPFEKFRQRIEFGVEW